MKKHAKKQTKKSGSTARETKRVARNSPEMAAKRPPEPRSPAPASEKTSPFASLAPALDDWKAGATIHELVPKYGVKRSKLRRALIALAGGKLAFKALRQEGAGGTVVPFGGKRATGGVSTASIDDSDVERVSGTKGWRVERVWRPRIVNIKDVGTAVGRELQLTIHTSPAGVEYVRAFDNEKADLIVVSKTGGIPDVRLRKADSARATKHVKREEKEIERGEQALERVRERKSKARRERKAKKHRRSAA